MGEGGDFIAHERRVAVNVRDACVTPVRQLFLSSQARRKQEQSDHLRARQITGDLLRNQACRSPNCGRDYRRRSAAFEVMRDMVYNLPVLTPPRWVRSRTTPVALENLLYYLVQLLHHPARAHRVAGGRPGLSYQQQFTRFMAAANIAR
jgi:uncharacterized protein YbjT (DUF2867 family)